MTETTSKIAIACNIAEPTKECVAGALAFVINFNPGSGGESMHVYARSRSGRWIRKWERLHRLTNFRVKTIPPAHPRYSVEDIFLYDSLGKKYDEWGKPTLVRIARSYTDMADVLRHHRTSAHPRRRSFDGCDECQLRFRQMLEARDLTIETCTSERSLSECSVPR